jgi:hypothetical protein
MESASRVERVARFPFLIDFVASRRTATCTDGRDVLANIHDATFFTTRRHTEESIDSAAPHPTVPFNLSRLRQPYPGPDEYELTSTA